MGTLHTIACYTTAHFAEWIEQVNNRLKTASVHNSIKICRLCLQVRYVPVNTKLFIFTNPAEKIGQISNQFYQFCLFMFKAIVLSGSTFNQIFNQCCKYIFDPEHKSLHHKIHSLQERGIAIIFMSMMTVVSTLLQLVYTHTEYICTQEEKCQTVLPSFAQ